MNGSAQPAREQQSQARLHSKFTTQANALLRKNGVQQRRSWGQTLVIVLMPIFFCVLLWGLQKLVNNALDSADNRCGCYCNTCCQNIDGQDVCRNNSPENPCQAWENCKAYDTTRCGFEYSTSSQAGYCGFESPSTWPALMQVPRKDRVAVELNSEPNATAMYTGADKGTADAIAANLFFNPNLNPSDPAVTRRIAAAAAAFAGSNFATGTVYAAALSQLGLVLGTNQSGGQFYSLYLEPAFVATERYNATLLNLVKDELNANSIQATEFLSTFLGSYSFGQGDAPTIEMAAGQPVWQDNADDINAQLFCGYTQARCYGANGTSGYLQAWDFQNTSTSALNVLMWYNGTQRGRQGPPVILRVNQGINRATNAFLKWSLSSDNYQTWLLGLMEMPQGGSILSLDFASLLGPLFFSWLLQLLLPFMLVSLVYEKEKRLRTIMKMHGLGDVAYWAIQYCWFFVINFLFTWIMILAGSGINLSIFRRTSYSFQFVFYLLWVNCLIAFAFLLSSLFKSSKTAVVSSFLYVFATGLVGFLLLQQFVGQGYWWVILIQLVPGFALYRGLYEISQYAFRAAAQDGTGITWSKLSDPGNGLTGVMIIMGLEWLVFMLVAWYLEQVMDTGVGVPRHPLFFLGWFRGGKKKSRKGAHASADAVTIAVEAEDVRAERMRVEALPAGASNAAIVIRDLHKTFPPSGGGKEKQAVRGLTLAIERGECFGLLGPNGAGKSTTINILTGFLEPTEGTAIIEGCDIRQDMPAIHSFMGVCPQDNLLWERLTAREHLMFYGRMKNLKGEALKSAVDAALQSVNLLNSGVGDKQVRKYSGGMKRRLSVAISFIGNPLVVYLDEPSTGLDPASRQNLWSVVKAAKQERGIILTTHSMEEATVLCDRLGIFVDGTLVCIGNPKELTSRYGGYYVFTITTPPEQEQAADALVHKMSPGARLTYGLAGTRKYELPVQEVTLPGVFDVMAGAKQHLTVLDWGIANATLEEVFIKFARQIGAETLD